MGKLFILFSLFLLSCSENNKGSKDVLQNEEANTAENATLVNPNGIGIQLFKTLPPQIKQCSGLFVIDTAAAVKQYVFVNDLKGKAFLMMDDKLMELKLVKQTNIDKKTMNELYVSEDLEVELKITLDKNLGANAWNYNGVLVVKKEGREEAINVTGKLGC
jgi:hypothetical protein